MSRRKEYRNRNNYYSSKEKLKLFTAYTFDALLQINSKFFQDIILISHPLSPRKNRIFTNHNPLEQIFQRRNKNMNLETRIKARYRLNRRTGIYEDDVLCCRPRFTRQHWKPWSLCLLWYCLASYLLTMP